MKKIIIAAALMMGATHAVAAQEQEILYSNVAPFPEVWGYHDPVLVKLNQGQIDSITDYIKTWLKDPDSIQVKNIVAEKDFRLNTIYYCVSYNAKNAFGGYGDYQIFYGEMSDNDPYIAESPIENMSAEPFLSLEDTQMYSHIKYCDNMDLSKSSM